MGEDPPTLIVLVIVLVLELLPLLVKARRPAEDRSERS
jgi:hypothetical protein